MRKFFKEFGAFIKRGNVLDMAVGVIVGGGGLSGGIYCRFVRLALARVFAASREG